MAEAKEKTKELPAAVKTADGEVVQTKELVAMLDKATVDTSKDLVNEYFTMEAGEEERVVYLGLTEMKNQQGEMGEAIRLFTKKGEVINADKVLVSAFRREKAPFAALITCTGWGKSTKGKYREFTVNPLELKS